MSNLHAESSQVKLAPKDKVLTIVEHAGTTTLFTQQVSITEAVDLFCEALKKSGATEDGVELGRSCLKVAIFKGNRNLPSDSARVEEVKSISTIIDLLQKRRSS